MYKHAGNKLNYCTTVFDFKHYKDEYVFMRTTLCMYAVILSLKSITFVIFAMLCTIVKSDRLIKI